MNIPVRHSLLYWILVSGRLCAVWLRGSIGVSISRLNHHCPFVASTYKSIHGSFTEAKNCSTNSSVWVRRTPWWMLMILKSILATWRRLKGVSAADFLSQQFANTTTVDPTQFSANHGLSFINKLLTYNVIWINLIAYFAFIASSFAWSYFYCSPITSVTLVYNGRFDQALARGDNFYLVIGRTKMRSIGSAHLTPEDSRRLQF